MDDAVASECDVVGVLEFGEVRVRSKVFENRGEGVLGVRDVVEFLILCNGFVASGVG